MLFLPLVCLALAPSACAAWLLWTDAHSAHHSPGRHEGSREEPSAKMVLEIQIARVLTLLDTYFYHILRVLL